MFWLPTGYNTYSVIVNRTNTSDESITWYLNGTAYFTATESQVGTATWQAAVDHGFFLILDVAIGGGYPNGVCGCTSPSSSTSSGAAMSVGYVAVYTTTGSGGAAVVAGRRRRRRHVVHHDRDVGHLRRLLLRQPGNHQRHVGDRGQQPQRRGREPGLPAHQRRLP